MLAEGDSGNQGKGLLKLKDEEIEANWELGYEVCFYRDYYRFRGRNKNNGEGYSPKRTFGLCLFSENRISIIESKVFCGFTGAQLESLGKDICNVKEVIKEECGKDVQVNIHMEGKDIQTFWGKNKDIDRQGVLYAKGYCVL